MFSIPTIYARWMIKMKSLRGLKKLKNKYHEHAHWLKIHGEPTIEQLIQENDKWAKIE